MRATGKALLGIVALVAASCVFILAYDYFTQTRHFQASQIVVTGQQRLSRTQVLKIAGVGREVNILAVNLMTTRMQLLANPWIADVTISREIPSRLRFHIQEEKPLALLEMPEGQRFLINTAGKVFKRDDGSGHRAFTRVQGLSHADLPVTGKPDTKAFNAVMALFRLADRKAGRHAITDIRRIRMDRDIGATVFIGEENRAVKLGFGRYREKMDALEQVMVRLKKMRRWARCRVIDLFDVNRIVISLAPAGPSDPDHEEV